MPLHEVKGTEAGGDGETAVAFRAQPASLQTPLKPYRGYQLPALGFGLCR